MKAVMKYPGSKWSIAKWIISLFPEHHSYLEPFFGSGAVLFNKPRSNIETVNDLDGNVVNLFDWIRKDPERLAHEIYYTPYARQVYEDAFAAVPEEASAYMIAYNQAMQDTHNPNMAAQIAGVVVMSYMTAFKQEIEQEQQAQTMLGIMLSMVENMKGEDEDGDGE